jgi:hypothetical protein
VGHVETAAPGLGQPRARRRNDYCVRHVLSPGAKTRISKTCSFDRRGPSCARGAAPRALPPQRSAAEGLALARELLQQRRRLPVGVAGLRLEALSSAAPPVQPERVGVEHRTAAEHGKP